MTIAQELDALGLPGLPEALPRPVIDNHTHADETTRVSSLSAELSLRAAASVRVSRIVQVGCDVESSRYAVELAERSPRVVASVAMHPNDAARRYLAGGEEALEADLAAIEPLIASLVVRAVGETGLDYYRTRDAAAPWSSTTAMPTMTSCVCWTTKAGLSASSCTASLATPISRRPVSSAAPG